MARGLHGGASVCRRLMTDAYVLFIFAAGGFIVDLNFCFLLKISVFYTILSLCCLVSICRRLIVVCVVVQSDVFFVAGVLI